MSEYAQKIVDAVLKITAGPVGNHTPLITAQDRVIVEDQLYDFGSYRLMTKFERLLADKCDRSHAIAVASGSAGLELALTALGVGPGDFVMVPAISFVATANAVQRRGAMPIFVDVEPDSYGMDPQSLLSACLRLARQAMHPKAIIAVHALGHPCRIMDIADIAQEHGISLIEDAAEALGSVVTMGPDGTVHYSCGGFGDISIISFNLNKIVTAGGGGAVLTDNEDIASHIHHLATTARIPHRFEIAHDPGGWNHRMPMLSAALAFSQLTRLDHLVAAKRALAAAYREVFAWLRDDDVVFHEEPRDTLSNFWLPSIRVKKEEREAVLTSLNDAGLGSRALFTPIPRLEAYQRAGTSYPVADEAHATTVCLPAGIELAERFL